MPCAPGPGGVCLSPIPPGWRRLPTGHDLLSPLSYHDRHILNRAKNFVAVRCGTSTQRS